MPVYVRYSGWYVYSWTNDNEEPIHFHISEGKPTENATKIWIMKNEALIRSTIWRSKALLLIQNVQEIMPIPGYFFSSQQVLYCTKHIQYRHLI